MSHMHMLGKCYLLQFGWRLQCLLHLSPQCLVRLAPLSSLTTERFEHATVQCLDTVEAQWVWGCMQG